MAITITGSPHHGPVLGGPVDVLGLATRLGALLASIQGGGDLKQISDTSGGTLPAAPVVAPGIFNEIVLSGSVPFDGAIPGGHNFVVATGSVPANLTGSDVQPRTRSCRCPSRGSCRRRCRRTGRKCRSR
jgi:hypothetical protein